MIVKAGHVTLRWFRSTDLADLVDLFAACYPAEKWTAEDLHAFAHKRDTEQQVKSGNIIKVLVAEDKLLAALLYTVKSGNCALRRLAVHPDHRREGLAKYALQTLTGPRSLTRCRAFTARVRESWLPAQLLLRSADFRCDSIERGRYTEPREDAYLFCKLRADVA